MKLTSLFGSLFCVRVLSNIDVQQIAVNLHLVRVAIDECVYRTCATVSHYSVTCRGCVSKVRHVIACSLVTIAAVVEMFCSLVSAGVQLKLLSRA